MKKHVIFTAIIAATISGCGGSNSSSTSIVDNSSQGQNTVNNRNITLNFALKSFQDTVDCSSLLQGYGLDGQDSVQLQDVRFYVSDIQLTDRAGNTDSLQFENSDFQYSDETGAIALIDFTDLTTGLCQNSSGGTARINSQITGETSLTDVANISFKVGVPQAMMKKITASYTTEDAPTPLNEMYWSWASGYRHLVFNFQVNNAANQIGDGAVHIGSRNCGSTGTTMLSDQDNCEFINTPSVSLTGFNPQTDVITLQLDQLMNSVAFTSEMTNDSGDIIGTQPGVSCHSAPAASQPDCGPIFNNLGIASDGSSQADLNQVFSFETSQ